jgi:putative transposase
MRPSKFTEGQIVQALRRVKAGTPAVQVCRELGVTQTTFYRWRKKYDQDAVNELRELEELRDENLRLKQIVTDILLDKRAAGDFRGRKS